MNKTRKIISLLLVIFTSIFSFTSCSEANDDYNSANKQASYVEQSNDYSFWEQENQLRFFISISIKNEDVDSDGITEIGDLELPRKYKKRTETLKTAMISYFNEKYNIDISAKLSNQKLKAFTSNQVDEMTMGYVEPNHPDVLNLNQCLFDEYSILFDNTYVHESLHQIGFVSSQPTMLDEGITDALTDLILNNANIASFPTESYGETRGLAYQILEVDTELVSFYLDNPNFQIQDRIDEKLKDVPRPFEKKNPGNFLNAMLICLMNDNGASIDPYYVAFQAQEIVRAYCQTFNPSHQNIDYIRHYYIATNYEKITIEEEGAGYGIYLN